MNSNINKTHEKIQSSKNNEINNFQLPNYKMKTKQTILPRIKNQMRDIKDSLTTSNRSISSANSHNYIENYKICEEIGHGSFGKVLEGINRLTGKHVAIKAYDKYKLIVSQRKGYVRREIAVMRRLNHDNIIKFIEVVNTAKEIYIIMEFVNGISLFDYMKSRENERINEQEAIPIFKQIVEGIKYCHENNVIHRDIKLENIIVDKNLNAKIIDFGFSTWFSEGQRLKLSCGTPSYMAPEIVAKKEYYGPPTDIWSLGVLLYTMLTGNFPFHGAIEQDLYKNILRGTFNIPSYISDKAKRLISQMMNKNPESRPKAEEVLNDQFFSN